MTIKAFQGHPEDRWRVDEENKPENTKCQADEKLKENNVTFHGGKQINMCQRDSQYVSIIATVFWPDNYQQSVVVTC